MHCQNMTKFTVQDVGKGHIVVEVCRAQYKPKTGHEFWFIMHYRVSLSLRSIIILNKSNNEVRKTFKFI